MLAFQGRLDEGVAEGKRAAELDPLSPQIPVDAAFAFAWKGDYPGALEQARRAADLDSTFFFSPFMLGWIDLEQGKAKDAVPYLRTSASMQAPSFAAAWLGYAYGASGDRAQALAQIDEQNKMSLHSYVPPFNLAIIYLGIGDNTRAMDYLEQAYSAHSQWLCWLKTDRIFDPLRTDPRFMALLKKLNFEK